MISENVIFNLCLFGQNDKLFQYSHPLLKVEFLDCFGRFLKLCNVSFPSCFGDKSTRLIKPLPDSTVFAKMQHINLHT